MDGGGSRVSTQAHPSVDIDGSVLIGCDVCTEEGGSLVQLGATTGEATVLAASPASAAYSAPVVTADQVILVSVSVSLANQMITTAGGWLVWERDGTSSIVSQRFGAPLALPDELLYIEGPMVSLGFGEAPRGELVWGDRRIDLQAIALPNGTALLPFDSPVQLLPSWPGSVVATLHAVVEPSAVLLQEFFGALWLIDSVAVAGPVDDRSRGGTAVHPGLAL